MTRIIYICLLCLAFQEAFSQDTLKYPLKWVNQSKLLNSSSVDRDSKTKKSNGFSFTAEYKFIDKIDTKDLKVFRVLTLQQTKTFTTDFTKTIYKISELEYHTSDYASKKWLDTLSYSINIDNKTFDKFPIVKNPFTSIPQIPKKYPAEITLDDKDYVSLDKKKMLSKYRSLKYPRFYLDLDFGLSAAKRFLLITQTQVSNYNPVDARRRNEKEIFSYGGNLKIGVLNGLAHSAYFEYQLLRQGFSGYELDWDTGLSSGTNRKEYTFVSQGIGIGYSYSNYRKIHSLAMDVSLTHHWMSSQGGLDQSKINDKLISGKFALGYKRRIGPDTDLRIMPTLYTNFKAINKIDAGLNTSLFNLGLSLGIRQYICQKTPDKPSFNKFPKIVSEVDILKTVAKKQAPKDTTPPPNNNFQFTLDSNKTKFDLKNQNPIFGGISGIEYVSSTKTWYMITDAASKTSRQSYLLRFTSDKDGLPAWENHDIVKLPGISAAESIRYSDIDKSLYISTEKDTSMQYDGTMKTEVFYKYKVDTNEIHKSSIKPKHIRALPIKEKYKPDRGFESLLIQNGILWSIREQPEYMNSNNTYLISWDKKGKLLNEYSYLIETQTCQKGKDSNGIVEILHDDTDSSFLVLERCYNDSTNLNTVILFKAKINGNTLAKTPICDFKGVLNSNINPDNIEGMTWGPKIDGKRTIVFISDNNFNTSQKTNFIVLKEK